MLAHVFDLIDHNGSAVRCSATAWSNKILANHPELEGREDDIRRTISDPDQVLQDRDYPDRRHFIRRLPRTRFFVDVIVEYAYDEGTVSGRIVTAFVRERVRRGDTVLHARPRRR